MAEPFGIIGVIGVAAQLIEMTVKFGLDLKDAPSDARAFVLELSTLRTVLERTQENVIQNSDFFKAFEGYDSIILSQLGEQPSPQTAAKTMLSTCEADLRKMVQDLTKRAQSSRVSWETLKGAFAAKKTRDAVENLNRQCQALNSMASIDAITIGARTHCEVLEIHKAVKQVQEHQFSQEKKEKRKLILDWLTPIDYAPQQTDFIRKRQPGTGQWLLDSPEFQAWLQADKHMLFCPGIPGAGKTILTAVVIEHLINQQHNNPNIGIAYIYCNFRRNEEQRLDDLLASLLRQFAELRPLMPKTVTELYKRHKAERTRPSADELSKALHEISASFLKAFILIDALDECQTSGGCRVRLIQEVFGLQAHCGLNLFVTSRFIPEITDKFDKSCWFEIRASKEDVERYLDNHIRQSSTTIQQMHKEIKIAISNAVDGMFLLARIYFDSLKSEKRPRKIRAVLEGLRKQVAGSGESERLKVLRHAYDDAMSRIDQQDPSDRDLAIQVLSWITYAKRPLTTIELQHALTIEEGDSTLDEEDLLQVDDMVAVCAGLVTVDEESRIIRLVHFTTQEYFQQTQTTHFPNAEHQIFRTCITYLSFSQFEMGACHTDDEFERRLQNNPLYDYAAQNWGLHSRHDSVSTEEIIQFLRKPYLIEASCQALPMTKKWQRNSGYSQEYPRRMTGVHVLACFGMVEVLQELLDAGADVHASTKDGSTALHYASRYGHYTVVQHLLAAGADIYAITEDGSTALHYASQDGHDAVVQYLLGNKANVHATDEKGWTALHRASRYGHDTIVQHLLAAGADINASTKNSWTALHRASRNGHDIYAFAKNSWTALHWSSCYGHDTVVQQLLAAGADVNASAEDRSTALHWASWYGQDAVVQQLLAAGADAHASTEDGSTALHWASWYGQDTVVQRLLAAGVDAHASTKDGSTALHRASQYGKNTIVQYLLTAGASVHATDEDGWTALHWASQYGHDMVVQHLLAAGADVYATDKYSWTALHRASRYGHYTVVQHLLAAGADVYATDENGWTALQYASQYGHYTVVQHLRAARADEKDGNSN